MKLVFKKSRYHETPEIEKKKHEKGYQENPEIHQKFQNKRYLGNQEKSSDKTEYFLQQAKQGTYYICIEAFIEAFIKAVPDYLRMKNIKFSLQNCAIH